MSCGCGDSPFAGNDSYNNLCNSDTPYPITSAESVPSLISNLTYALYGEIQKDASSGKIVWVIPCDPNNTVQIGAVPRNAGEGLMCYLMRVINDTIKEGIIIARSTTTSTSELSFVNTYTGQDSFNAVKISAVQNVLKFSAGGSQWLSLETAGHLLPTTSGVQNLGSSSKKWKTLYATTGTINTSDLNQKQDIEELSDCEKRVALKLKNLVKKFKFKDAVEKKGDNARIHVGVIAQDVVAAFASEGLDAMKYGMLCYDEWEASEWTPAGNSYGVRYEELLAFIISAL